MQGCESRLDIIVPRVVRLDVFIKKLKKSRLKDNYAKDIITINIKEKE